MVDKPKDKSQDVAGALHLWSLAGELGFQIALPLLVFLIIGIYLDRTLNTKPLFMIGAIALSLISSSLLVYRIIRRVNQELL